MQSTNNALDCVWFIDGSRYSLTDIFITVLTLPPGDGYLEVKLIYQLIDKELFFG